MTICRENRIQESEFRIQEKSSSCLFSSTGVTTSAMTIYRENRGQWVFGLFLSLGAAQAPRHIHLWNNKGVS
jgi:hypothetical protein